MEKEIQKSEAQIKVKSNKGKKRKQALKGFDARGIQTLYRTISKNHYQLLKMVDSKASIILTVNSIIISLLMGAIFIVPENQAQAIGTVTSVMINFCMLSMIFALLSMLPHKYIGRNFTKSNYAGTLYAGNFSTITFEEFHLEFRRITKNGRNIYKELTSDIYFLGKTIKIKQQLIQVSVLIFLVGLIWAIIYTTIYN